MINEKRLWIYSHDMPYYDDYLSHSGEMVTIIKKSVYIIPENDVTLYLVKGKNDWHGWAYDYELYNTLEIENVWA